MIEVFRTKGWDISKPNLLGYPWEDRIQLVSGSHRWAAADKIPILVPVNLYSYEFMQDIWGTDAWVELIKSHT